MDTSEEYVNNGGHLCPRCHSENVQTVQECDFISETKLIQSVVCSNCGLEYEDEYVLTGYSLPEK